MTTLGALNLFCLGGFRLEPALDLGRKKAQALLAYLAVRPGETFLRDKLASLLWGDSSDDQARHSLRQALLELKRACGAVGPLTVLIDADRIGLDPAVVEVDVVSFERLATGNSAEGLARAAALYQGDFLDGFIVDAVGFEEWLRTERARLHELALEVLARLLAFQMSDETAPAITTALRLLTLDPLQEVTHRALMRLYARSGRRAAAMHQYQLCVDVLQRELGIEPEPSTQQLYQAILAEVPARFSDAESHSPRKSQPRRAQSRSARRLRSIASPFIGRQAEMNAVRRCLKDAWRKRGGFLTIIGEAGVGKTRLVDDLMTIAGRRNGSLIVGRAYESTQVFAFGPWVDALRDVLRHDRETFDDLNPVWQAELTRLLPELGTAADEQMPPDPARLFEAVSQFLTSLAARSPLVLVLEDLHWADEMSLRLAAFLAHRIAASRVLVVLTAREEEIADNPFLVRTLDEIDRHLRVTTLPLAPLSRHDTTRLFHAIAGPDAAGTAAARLDTFDTYVWKMSEGNPFLVIETLRAIRQDSTLDDPFTLPLPKRTHELVTARLGRLSDQSRHVVAVASVIGREFDFALVQHAAGLSDRDAAAAVDELVRRRVFHGIGDKLDFVHDRIREVAVIELLPAQRRLVHRLIAASIESVYAGQLELHYAVVALHHYEAAAWDKAAYYLRLAAKQAIARSAYGQAVTTLEQALDALGHLPETREALEQAIDLRCDLCLALDPVEGDKSRLELLLEARRLAERIGDDRRLWSVLRRMGRTLVSDYADYPAAIETSHTAIAVARRIGDPDLEIPPSVNLGHAYQGIGAFAQAITVLRGVVNALGDAGSEARFEMLSPPSCGARIVLAHALVAVGEFDEAIHVARDAISIGERIGHLLSVTDGHNALGSAYLAKQDGETAIATWERGLLLARQYGLAFEVRLNSSCLGFAYALSGRVDEGVRLLEDTLNEIPGRRMGELTRLWTLIRLGWAYTIAKRLDAASQCAQDALTLSRKRSMVAAEVDSLRLVGHIAARREMPDLEDALNSYESALTLAEGREMHPRVAQCCLDLGTLHHRLGKKALARSELTRAIDLFRSIGMSRDLERAEAELEKVLAVSH